MNFGDIFKSKKQRLINSLNRSGLYPQAILISQFDGSNWLMNDERVSLEIDLLVAQNVSRDAALISLSRFIRSKDFAYSFNLSKEALFFNEYCIIYRLYVDLLDSLENDIESFTDEGNLEGKYKSISRLTIKELLNPDLPIIKSDYKNDGVEQGKYFVGELNDKYQLFIFFSNPQNAIQEFKSIISKYIEKAESDKISSQSFQLWQNNIRAVTSLDDSKFERWISETKEHVFFALSNQIIVQLSKGVSLYRIDFLGLPSNDLDAIVTPVYGPIIFNKPYSNPTREIHSNEKLSFSKDQLNRIVLFVFSLISDSDNLLLRNSRYLSITTKDFESFSDSEEFQCIYDNLLKVEIGCDWLDAEIIEQIFNWFHSEYTNYERILILSELYSSVRNSNGIKAVTEKFDKIRKAYLLNHPGSALLSFNSNRVSELFGVNFTLLIMQTNIEKENSKFEKYAASLGLTNQEFFEHLLVTNDVELEKYRNELTLGLPLNFIDLPTNLKVNSENKNILNSNESEELNSLLRDNKMYDAYAFLLTKLEIISQKNFDFNQYNFQIILNFAGMSINLQEDLERVELILNSIAIDPRFKDVDAIIQSELFGVLGLNQSYQNKEDDAIENFTNALELNPLDARTLGNRGCSYFNIGEFELAITDLDQAINLGLDDNFALAGIYSNKARCYIQMFDGFDNSSLNYLIEAKSAITKAIVLSPEVESHQDILFKVEVILGVLSDMSDDTTSNEND